MALDAEAQDLVFERPRPAGLPRPAGHVDGDDAAALGPLDVEVHAQVRGAEAVDLGRVRERPGARPLVRRRLAERPDLARRAQQRAAFRGGLDARHGRVELHRRTRRREEFRVQEVRDRDLFRCPFPEGAG